MANPMSRAPKRKYLLYDRRALLQGTDEATVLTVSNTLKEARRDAGDGYGECHIYEYDVDESTRELTNERYVETRGKADV